MKGRTVAFVALGIVALLVATWMTLSHRADPAAAPSDTVASDSVSGGGITLTSDRLTLPEETAALPAGNDLITVNCTSCHSPEMITAQPALDAKKWQATIDKMRTVYKAQIAPADDKALIAALTALPTQRPVK